MHFAPPSGLLIRSCRLSQVQSMERAVSDSEAPRRFNTGAIISAFAIAAVLLGSAWDLQRDRILGGIA